MSRTREVEVYSALTKLDPSAPYFVQSRTLAAARATSSTFILKRFLSKPPQKSLTYVNGTRAQRVCLILWAALRPEINIIYIFYENITNGNHQGEAPMRQFTIAAATIAIAALISAAPVSAENVLGGPIKQNGQCWQKQKGSEAGTFGYWQPCVEKANSPTVRQPARHRA